MLALSPKPYAQGEGHPGGLRAPLAAAVLFTAMFSNAILQGKQASKATSTLDMANAVASQGTASHHPHWGGWGGDSCPSQQNPVTF